MELLNTFLAEILSFIFYFQLLMREFLTANRVLYPFATYFVIMVTLAVSHFVIYKIVLLKNKKSYYSNGKLDTYYLKRDSLAETGIYITLLYLFTFLLPLFILIAIRNNND